MELPWPPSANKYWRYVRGRVLVSREARNYKATIKKLALSWGHACLFGRLDVKIDAFCPDYRRRDLDNILKICLDALQGAKLFKDDSQIDKLAIERMPVRIAHGEIFVHIQEY